MSDLKKSMDELQKQTSELKIQSNELKASFADLFINKDLRKLEKIFKKIDNKRGLEHNDICYINSILSDKYNSLLDDLQRFEEQEPMEHIHRYRYR